MHSLSMFKIGFVFLLGTLISGCQPAESPKIVNEHVESRAVKKPAVDLTEMCQNIEKDMANINDQRTTFALEEINQNLKVCLPLLDHDQQHQLMHLSTKMYQRFLTVERDHEQQLAFEHYALEMAQHPTIQQSHFQTLNSRDQYLLKHKGQAYVELIDLGEQQLNYRRSPDYLARIFAPYLPKSERVFIEMLAQQNHEPILQNGRLLISPQEMMTRALFWQEYLHLYPNSYFKTDAQFLMQQYRYYLFFGTAKSPVSETYLDRLAMPVDTLETIEQLAKMPTSTLSNQAKQYLQFLEMTPQQKAAILTDHEQSSLEQKLVSYTNSYAPKHPQNKNCFRDAVCI